MKRTMAIEMLVHFDQEAEQIVRKRLKEGMIEEAVGESPFYARGFFTQKPNGKGLHLFTDYRGEINQLRRARLTISETKGGDVHCIQEEAIQLR